jgi:putative spermidine/putrescine transport system ATP-binding protein
MKKAFIASAALLLDTALGPIKAEIDTGLPPHEIGSAHPFDLPVAGAANLKRFG